MGGYPIVRGTMVTTGGDHRDAIFARLSRIEGQVRGVRRMIEEERACAEVLPQLRSVINALCRVQDNVLHQHLRRCVRESFESGGDERDRKTEEIFSLLSRYREP
jgi:CsoR family transcriptional regulator, copper-sensing transcriptional repressor